VICSEDKTQPKVRVGRKEEYWVDRQLEQEDEEAIDESDEVLDVVCFVQAKNK